MRCSLMRMPASAAPKGQHEVVERRAVAQVEGHPAGNRQLGPEVQVDAVAAAADLGVVEDVIRHLRECQRDHDEVNAARAQRQGACHGGVGGRRQQGRGQQPPQAGGFRFGRQQRCRIGADTEERRMPQADQPRAADQQLQA
ncbi:hypothetical protein G6F68_017538 [Rhizopus microsporus]|nr:hypothetical protein G6F68_017538 [Rhizopus microsporus]KAG1392099.1 hypothetical protein G6F59_014697 [Rhizopus arrhizus]